ncbi:MAG: helix-turn-helix transcriptional regulator [Nitrosomonas sp.]|uniref:response regulator transcription factor n=1 Tax=Nitrosomonas sp. TaxID=42353 RepID=UPI001D27804C|nr:helix-turn-helix transcriptional regulator [Nitrosomonas sp.]MCB1949632.1 hypothetical protein [Nitrosomonas sp.]MDR4517664.1 helix-turn-helix transcriptional regulator [Nitrosomonas sp.]
MDKDIAIDGLADADRQKTLAIVNWLNNCQHRNDLNQVLKEAVLPLLACNGVFYVRLADDHSNPQLINSINQSTCCQHSWMRFLNTAIQKPAATQSSTGNPNPLLPVGVDMSMRCNGTENSFHHSFDQNWQQSHHCSTMLTFRDDQSQACQFYFCRLHEKPQIYSPRDFALLNILRPSLLQAFRFIQFQEKSLNADQITQFWSEHTEPVAVIRSDGNTLFQSHAFEKIIKQEFHSFQSTAATLVKSAQREKLEWFSFLSKLGRRLYEIKLTLINHDANYQRCTYLMHLSRVAHQIGKIFNQLNRKGLTHRELEIALLIFRGTATRDIAETIHLSYHTVRNHIKSIYSKLGVSSREEMLVWVG